jgi:diguanylate cyclase (GGDEF)-like protein
MSQVLEGVVALAALGFALHTLVTNRRLRRATRALRDIQRAAEGERSFLAAVVEQMTGRVTVVDVRGRLLLRNAATRRDAPQHGMPGTEDLYAADGRTPLAPEETPMARALRGETVRDAEVVAGGPDAESRRRLLVSGGRVVDAAGRPLGAVTTAVDVTEMRRAERESERLSATLRTVQRVARELPADGDVAAALCRAAREVSGASVAMLYEFGAGPHALTMTGADGYSGPRPVPLPLAGATARATIEGFAAGASVFASARRPDERIAAPWVRRLGLEAALVQPAVRGGRALGVLVAGWREPGVTPGGAEVLSIELLADEAGAALERAALLRRLLELSDTDALTGLANRRQWDREFPRELARAARHEYPVAVAVLDLDHFKAYNDRRGHQAGDAVLKRTAAAWRGAVRDTDLLARWGGEEFVLCLPNCGRDAALGIVTRMRSLLPQGQTCSAGVAAWDGAETAEALLARADAAMYEAKALGRDRVETAV